METRTYVVDTPERMKAILAFIARLNLATTWQIAISEHRSKRSNAQNDRLWKLHRMAASVTGHSADEMHEFALCKFFGYNEVRIGGITRQVPNRRSSQRNTAEFSEFMESTEAWYASELGVMFDER